MIESNIPSKGTTTSSIMTALEPTYFCANVCASGNAVDAEVDTDVLDPLGLGVGRIGAPAVLVIHDFCRAPPNKVFNVAFEVSTSLSETAEGPSLSGGLRIV